MVSSIMNRTMMVNMSEKSVAIQPTDSSMYAEWLGGKGIGLKMLVDMDAVRQDPFSPENPLIFVTGPFTGSLVQTSARIALVTKSPLTGSFLDSHVGGFLGPQVKRAGIDALVIRGASPEPLILHVSPAGAEFLDAGDLWGKGKFETEKILVKRFPGSQVACIGPAGENRVRFSCIGTHLHRQFGRGGAGAVMGSKGLKAIVFTGKERMKYHDDARFRELTKQLTRDVMAHPNRELRNTQGTNYWTRAGNEKGLFLPTRNCQQGQFESYENLTSENFRKHYGWESTGCFNCGIQCAKVVRWKDRELEGPEYETVAWLGSNCGIADPEVVFEANYMADDLGLDTISLGATIAFAMEAFEKGILTSADTGGLELKFGNGQALLECIRLIANREGIGEILSEGTRRASQEIGGDSDFFALQTAGMELSGVNIKGSASMGLGMATADFASHTRIWSATAEMNGELTFENTPAYLIEAQDEVNVRDSLIVCDFLPFGNDRLAPIYEAATGISMTPEKLMEAGKRIFTMARMFNLANGRTRVDDRVPGRYLKEPHFAGIFKGKYMTPEIFSEWLDHYYDQRGWNRDGIPEDKILREQNLRRL